MSSAYICKYCKEPASESDIRCEGPCRKFMHLTCSTQAYHNHKKTSINYNNIYCFSCRINTVRENPLVYVSTRSRKSSPSSSVSSTFCSTSSTTKSHVKNQLDSPNSSGNSNLNPPKTNTFTSPAKKSSPVKNGIDNHDSSKNSNLNLSKIKDTCSASPTKKSPNVKNQIDTPGSSGNSNVDLNISPTSADTCKKRLEFKTCSLQPVEYLYLSEEIAKTEKEIKKCIEYLQKYSKIQIDKLSQISESNSLNILRTTLETRMENIEKIQSDSLKEIQTFKTQSQEITNYLVEIKYQLSQIYEKPGN